MARGEGLRVRLSRISGESAAGVLSRPIYLPAVLDGFAWSEDFEHSEYGTIRGGQFSQPAMGPASARQLRKLDDVATLTVEWDPAWLVVQGQDPADVRAALFAVGRSRTPVTLLAALKLGGAPLLRVDVTFRSIHTEMRRGEADSLYYTCSISEWRKASGKRKGAGTGNDKLPTTHLLTVRDTLYSLSMAYYNSYAGADDIARANGITKWGKNDPLVRLLDRFKIGSKIKIPRIVTTPHAASSSPQHTTGS